MRRVSWTAALVVGFVSSVVVASEGVVVEERRDLNGHGQITLASSRVVHHPHFPQSQKTDDEVIPEALSSSILDKPPSVSQATTSSSPQQPVVIAATSDEDEENSKKKTPAVQDFKTQLSELEQLRKNYAQLEKELKQKTQDVHSLSGELCDSKSVWECQMRPFCVISVLLGWNTHGVVDAGRCLQRLESVERGAIHLLGGETVRKEKRRFWLEMLLESSIVVLGSLVMIGAGLWLRAGKGKNTDEILPILEPREEGQERRGFWKRMFGFRRKKKNGGSDEEAPADEKVPAERVEEEVVRDEQVSAPPPPGPRIYVRQEIHEHIENWGMGVQEGLNEAETQEPEQEIEEEGYVSERESEPESELESELESEPESVDSLAGVTMSQEIASFRDAFGLVEDLLAAVEQRDRS
ncbi:hypothetical protein QBC43DRAFT_316284 [Cladorrhinum sp. PSN259]|nr:hypothetical protein QBC43DRAFT_316284 [Cladorrhinum sp. PSN259]